MKKMKPEHAAMVTEISRVLKAHDQAGTAVKIYHGSTNSTRAQHFDPDRMLDLSGLNQILEVDEEGRTITVEPNVTMEALVRATLEHGLVPPVVMEFRNITVGGGIQGGSGESSSFKEGLFHEICEEYEMVLGNGEVVTTSRTERPELFWGTACSYGTLGVITQIKLRLVPATRYVRLRYERVGSMAQWYSAGVKATRSRADFVDGILFGPDQGVIMTGVRTDERQGPAARFTRARDDWFAAHAECIVRRSSIYEELIPLEDYLFRYDRGGFWVGWAALRRYHIPCNRMIRFLLDKFLRTKELYRILHATNVSQEYIVQDFCLPSEKALEFAKDASRLTGIFPLWLCPLKPDPKTPFSPTNLDTELVLNLGVYGETKTREYEKLLALNRELEGLAAGLGGRKVLYAHAYYSEDEFWSVYDAANYARLREEYKALRAFPNIYEKVTVRGRYQKKVTRGLANLFLEQLSLSQ